MSQDIVKSSTVPSAGAAGDWGEFDQANPTTWVFVLGTAFWLTVLAGIHYMLEARRRA
jgi:hypothetical protein